MNPVTTSIPELLAPAGGPAALRAAVANGADAVYLGLDTLNARRGAENFTLDTLRSACDYAHLRGARIYLTANIALLPSEVPAALEMVAAAWSAGVDAVIIQDLGLVRAVRSSLPQVRIHASTQLNTHSSATVRALASCGVSRVTLSRETSLEQISVLAEAARAIGVEVESFVHGALCVCYSGQCLLSSLIGGRSANRGLCAQPCRLSYELVSGRDVVHETPGAHLLSPRDLAGVAVLPSFIEAGVASLKIEGRMKSAEYVALVTGVYRAALDRAAAAPEAYRVRDGELSVLEEAFSRGFTEAYLTGERGNEMMSYRRPNNRGVPVGRVSSVEGPSHATVSFEKAVDSDDTIEVWTRRGRFAQPVGGLHHAGSVHASVPAGVKAWIEVSEPVGVGDRVFRVRNAALTAAAQRTFADPTTPPIGLSFEVAVVAGAPLRVRVTDARGRAGEATGPIVESARTKAITAEEVMEHVGRLGNTPYVAEGWSVDLSAGAGLGYSVLHKVRREALEDYEATVLAEWRRPVRPQVRPPKLPAAARPVDAPRLAVAVGDVAAAVSALEAGADEVHVPAWALQHDALVPGIVPVLPRVCHDDEWRLCGTFEGVERVVAGTLGAIASRPDGTSAQAHWSLNALNAYSVAELAQIGASLVWLSPELAAAQLREVASAAGVATGAAVSGRQELMVTEHCILMAEGPCSGACDTCARRSAPRRLKDRKGFEFPVITDPTGRSHVYNSVPLDLTHVLPDLLGSGIHALRIDAETLTPHETAIEVSRVKRALDDALRGRTPEKRGDVPTTSGHHFRGVR